MKQDFHLAIIMDGNRRWAKKHALQPWKGHERGRDVLEMLLDFCAEKAISQITLYTFSMQNLNRSQPEVDFLLKLFKDSLTDKKFLDKIHANKVCMRFIGRLDLFDDELQAIFAKVMQETAHYSDFILNSCVAYGGQEELTDACKKIASQVASGALDPQAITEETVQSALYLQDAPDMIIRTGGDHRLSNFLSWQSAYSELFFVDELFPDMTPELLDSLLEEFHMRERRFGR